VWACTGIQKSTPATIRTGSVTRGPPVGTAGTSPPSTAQACASNNSGRATPGCGLTHSHQGERRRLHTAAGSTTARTRPEQAISNTGDSPLICVE
jgi:hypothetical protein